jgi:hypothetical protein
MAGTEATVIIEATLTKHMQHILDLFVVAISQEDKSTRAMLLTTVDAAVEATLAEITAGVGGPLPMTADKIAETRAGFVTELGKAFGPTSVDPLAHMVQLLIMGGKYDEAELIMLGMADRIKD